MEKVKIGVVGYNGLVWSVHIPVEVLNLLVNITVSSPVGDVEITSKITFVPEGNRK